MSDEDRRSLHSLLCQHLASDPQDALVSFPLDQRAHSDRALYYRCLFLQWHNMDACCRASDASSFNVSFDSVLCDVATYEPAVVESIFCFLIHAQMRPSEAESWRAHVVSKAIACVFDSANDHAALDHRCVLFLELGLLLALKWGFCLPRKVMDQLKGRAKRSTCPSPDHGLVSELVALMEGCSPFAPREEQQPDDDFLFLLSLCASSSAALSDASKQRWLKLLLASDSAAAELAVLGYDLLLSFDPLPFEPLSLLRLASFRLGDRARPRLLYDKIQIIERALGSRRHETEAASLESDFLLELRKNWRALLQHRNMMDRDFPFLSHHSLSTLASFALETAGGLSFAAKQRAWTLLVTCEEDLARLDLASMLIYFRPPCSSALTCSERIGSAARAAALLDKLAAVPLSATHSELLYEWIVDWTRYLLWQPESSAFAGLEALAATWIRWIVATFHVIRCDFVLDYAYLLARGWRGDAAIFALFARSTGPGQSE